MDIIQIFNTIIRNSINTDEKISLNDNKQNPPNNPFPNPQEGSDLGSFDPDDRLALEFIEFLERWIRKYKDDFLNGRIRERRRLKCFLFVN